ncbi:MAG: bifunctional 23S rRNA (guanine(2069)-N(7))-methyltransferase RlmK/23S rRNA (guanine(2445)-N(2))-methyltransferase RlmL [Proteobacteria bacterium]|nr:bifunctional 23S rRNA (guanine(2069)-N(7))-methyltransferase RlmK/23S rRNA (guanine(2445)-N(2))-methyltransferase RlmL [Pseudomonadota bacterium]
MTNFTAFASCPKHLELLLKDELLIHGATEVREKLAGVSFYASSEVLMSILMWSRLANRFFIKLAEAKCANKTDLYDAISAIDWSLLTNDLANTLAIRFKGTNNELKNSHFSSQVCKDAVCDQLSEKYGKRPKLIKADAHLNIYARLKHKQLEIYQDITGHSLHQRGYRGSRTMAPLKENLAAAILIRSNWPELAKSHYNLIDPMCGSGTLLTEGWMIACDVAPNLNFKSHALFSWKHFDYYHWGKQLQQAEQRKEQGMATFRGQIFGVDHHKQSIDIANENKDQLDPDCKIHFQYQTLDRFKIPPRNNLIVTNPPYGVRLQKQNINSWKQLSSWLKQKAIGSQAAILTPDSSKGFMLGIREKQSYVFLNGDIEIKLRLLDIEKKSFLQVSEGQKFSLPAGAQMLANRLKKNLSKLRSWVNNNQIEAYRIYDADLPEYAVAIDIYKGYIHVQEYKAPKTIEESRAKVHLEQALLAIQSVLQIDPAKIHLKTRQKQKGRDQYNKNQSEQDKFIIHEYGRIYLIDLSTYLDTGLFLDHRWLRNQIQSEVKGKSVLNLFCYTGSISLAAAKGEATEVDSVDTSKTYLNWAKENFKINHIHSNYNMIRSDVMDYLESCNKFYDVIIADPPTFSNSHSRETDWEIQKDHFELLLQCKKLLKNNGIIYFSTNFKKFKMDETLSDHFLIEDITQKSLDKDFIGSKIHKCYTLKTNKQIENT